MYSGSCQSLVILKIRVRQDILKSLHKIPHTMAWIESEIDRISAAKPSIGAEPRPYASKATLPWERPDDGSEVHI